MSSTPAHGRVEVLGAPIAGAAFGVYVLARRSRPGQRYSIRNKLRAEAQKIRLRPLVGGLGAGKKATVVRPESAVLKHYLQNQPLGPHLRAR